MRFKLKLHVNKAEGDLLPLNYHYELSSAIYRILSQHDDGYAQWLHDVGYRNGNKRFKLFNFSDLYVPRYEISGDRMKVLSDFVEWELSFLFDEGCANFIHGVFKGQNFRVADKISGVGFRIDEIEMMPAPEMSGNMCFRTVSPVCVSVPVKDRPPRYLSPEDEGYADAILEGLLSRYMAAYGKGYDGEAFCDFRLAGKPKPVLLTIKADTPQQTRVKGYRFDFRISLPIELMRLMYDCGLGEKSSLGFGMIKII